MVVPGADMPAYRLVIFDFDGTLADTLPWFRSVFDGVAERFGLVRLTPDEFEALRNLSGREIIAKMKVPAWKLPFIVRHMRREKLAAAATTRLFAGVPELLADLKAAGLRVAIVSSDSEASVRAVLGPLVAHVDHFDCGAGLFGKAAKFRGMVKRTGLRREEVLSVGDELRDLEAALEADIAAAAVSWGYTAPEALERRRPTHLFHSIDALRAMLLPAPPPSGSER
ncbi:HAD hydrolase-like protein [Myxococcus stipitatus]|uniref:HAD hydrolase-like protein n=1 Tax=Myxococcus stipitatus TaxID=83455 RepID=UPI001F1E5AC5|nr:HAD hydrolase-like protein [Myxococcus stipitatus]MCE9666737.1 HAD hydrolase-like protein [Myxococcus stipitatus]